MANVSVWEVPPPRSAKGVEKFLRSGNYDVFRGNDNLIYICDPVAAVLAALIDLKRVS